MPNYLPMPKKQQVLALLDLGWTSRRIEAEAGVRRKTLSRYDRVRRGNAPPPGSRRLLIACSASALASARRRRLKLRGRVGEVVDRDRAGRDRPFARHPEALTAPSTGSSIPDPA